MALERSNMDTYYRAKELYVQGNLTESHKLLTNFIESQRGISGNAAAAAELTDAFNTRGHIHYRWVDFDEAILDYSEAIKLDPKFAVAYYNRGQVHYRLGRFKLAQVDLRQALSLQPSFPDAQLHLNQVEKDLNDHHEFNTQDPLHNDVPSSEGSAPSLHNDVPSSEGSAPSLHNNVPSSEGSVPSLQCM